MALTEVKNDFHNLIDEINNEKILSHFYELLKTLKDNKENQTDFWDLLSDEQKNELDLAIKESEDESNWISHEEVMRESKEWLKK